MIELDTLQLERKSKMEPQALQTVLNRIIPSSWPEENPQGLLLDNPSAKILKTIEWFDDRVYKVLLPPEFDPKCWKFFWSVTTILGIIAKPWLALWYGNLGTERARYQSHKARDRGSLVHNTIAEMISFDETGLGAPVDGTQFRQEDWLPVVRFAQWYNNFKPRIIVHDCPVVSYQHEYAGTLDIFLETEGGMKDCGGTKPAEVPEGFYPLDIKTGNESKDYFLQTAMYGQAGIESGLDTPDGSMILYLDAENKSGYKLVVRNKAEMAQDFQVALAAKTLFDARGQKLPELFEMPLGLQLQKY